jgi:DNA polymerase-2
MIWFTEQDPDVIIGWSIVGFDLQFLQDRADTLGLEFNLGRGNSSVSWRFLDRGQQRVYAVVLGRVALDGIELLRTATYSFDSFSLENVSRELLGRGKLVRDVDSRAVEIEEMHRNDQESLARYNLEECRLVLDIFKQTSLIDFAIRRTCLTGLEMTLNHSPYVNSAIGNDFYMGRQLAPIADAILGLKGNSLSLPINKQIGLFD